MGIPTVRAEPLAPPSKPAATIDRLERKFKRNANQLQAGQAATINRIHSALAGYSELNEADFKAQLRTKGIQVIDTGKQYVCIDHKSRNVFDENELGPLYSRAKQQMAFSERSIPMPSVRPRDPAIRTAGQPIPTAKTRRGTSTELLPESKSRLRLLSRLATHRRSYPLAKP